MKKLAGLGFLFLSCATGGQEVYVLRNPEALEDERVWPMLVGEKIRVCSGDTAYNSGLERVENSRLFFRDGWGLFLSDVDSVLIQFPLHEAGKDPLDILLATGYVLGGASLGFFPSLVVCRELLDPDVPGNEEKKRLTYQLVGASTLLGIGGGLYASYRYFQTANQSQALTQLFLKRLERTK